MKTHKDLEVWQAAIDLAREVYEATRSYPDEEKFGLVSQMRRCAVSIPSNIARPVK
ncbi:MAG: four helix bundle protein [Acidiferrobacterales bacterium]